MGWTKSVLGAAEAILVGTTPTVDSVAHATGLSHGALSSALRFLTQEGLLTASAARGRNAARRVDSHETLLGAYASAALSHRQSPSLVAGVLWNDPIHDAADLGAALSERGTPWAATGPLAAAAMAPFQTEIAPLEMYVAGTATVGQLHLLAMELGLRPIDGGRLTLRAFPLETTARLSASVGGLICVPWPRVFVDLQRAGVRGEDAAEHLRRAMIACLDGG